MTLDGIPDAFVTIDQWDSLETWTGFRCKFAAEYEALDLACEGLTREEEQLGVGVSP